MSHRIVRSPIGTTPHDVVDDFIENMYVALGGKISFPNNRIPLFCDFLASVAFLMRSMQGKFGH